MRWGVVGVGRAGRARARAIALDPGATLSAVCRGRFAHEFEAPEVGFDDLIQRVEAVAICSPSAEHEAQVRRALEADCDVVVEFPVALEPVAAQALFSLAQRQERLLHVEHIELLAPWHQALRQRIGRPEHVRVVMTKPGNGRETPDYFFGAALARLHCIAEYSPIQRIRQRWVEPGFIRADLDLADGRAEFELRSGEGFERRFEVDVVDERATYRVVNRRLFCDGDEVPLAHAQRSLFAQDHDVAMKRICAGGRHYVTRSRVIDCLTLTHELTQTQSSR